MGQSEKQHVHQVLFLWFIGKSLHVVSHVLYHIWLRHLYLTILFTEFRSSKLGKAILLFLYIFNNYKKISPILGNFNLNESLPNLAHVQGIVETVTFAKGNKWALEKVWKLIISWTTQFLSLNLHQLTKVLTRSGTSHPRI